MSTGTGKESHLAYYPFYLSCFIVHGNAGYSPFYLNVSHMPEFLQEVKAFKLRIVTQGM